VVMAISTNAGGGTLSGTKTRAASSGVATFNDLSIDLIGTAYKITATSGALFTPASAAFNITSGTATQLVLPQQPSSAVAAVSISPAITVTAKDANGNVDTNYATDIVVAISTNPGSGTLSGTTTRTPSSGVATFNNLTIDKVGTAYKLTATAALLTSAASS